MTTPTPDPAMTADQLLLFLSDIPGADLLEIVSDDDLDDLAHALTRRGESSGRLCLRCRETAGPTYVADTRVGRRWLDLCRGCSLWLQSNVTPSYAR